MVNSPVKEMRARAKKLLILSIPCAAVLVFLCFMIYSVSNYYATAYPYNTIGTLPNNPTTRALSIFNGYTEKVTTGINQTAILQSIDSIRNSEEMSVNSTIEDLVLAFLTVLLFGFLSIVLDRNVKAGQSKMTHLLPVIFLVALMESQYVMVIDKFLAHGTISGISLFFVDSLLTIIWFGVAIEALLGKYIKVMGPRLSKRSINFIKIAMILWPLILFLFLLLFLENIGLLAYNQNFLSTYLVHSIGLLGFVLLFAALFYYNDLHILERLRGLMGRS